MSRPDSFTNAMRGLLDPEAAAIEAYVASLEGKVDQLRAEHLTAIGMFNEAEAKAADYPRLADIARHRRLELENLKRLGEHLANAAYNISQCAGQPLSERAATALRLAYEEWDAAISRLGAP